MSATVSTIPTARQVDLDDVLHRFLRDSISAVHGQQSPIAGIQSRRCEFSSSYDCELLTVQRADGPALTLFLKDFGFSQIPKDQPDRRRERELHVYRELLPGAEE